MALLSWCIWEMELLASHWSLLGSVIGQEPYNLGDLEYHLCMKVEGDYDSGA